MRKCVNFGDEILLKGGGGGGGGGGEYKTREKIQFFLKNGKTVISVENRKFSRSRMTKRIAPLNLPHEI